ncbi:hypothetical protein ACXR2T_02325 [Leucobacter sp. HY1910]
MKLKSGPTTVWDAYLAPGTSESFGVPIGTYDLTYGAGYEWYGWTYAFGPEGAYTETRETFTFDYESCWTVELILQVGGNLSSSDMDYANF